MRHNSFGKQLVYWLEQSGMLAMLFLLVAICSITVNGFFSLKNLDSVLLAVSTVGIISCTMLFCLASGNFDLSVGAIARCAGMFPASHWASRPGLRSERSSVWSTD